jgi:hypothetical protein
MSQPLPDPRVDRATMADVFGEDNLATVAADMAGEIPDEATRVFLTEVGLPDQADTQGWFHRVLNLTEEVQDKGYDDLAEEYPDVAEQFHFEEWISLGEIPYDSIDVDAATGAVYATSAEGDEPYLLNTSLDRFAYLLSVAEAERPYYSGTAEQVLDDEDGRARVEARLERLYGQPLEQVGPTPEDRLRATIERVDPVALVRPDSTWHMVLRYITEGLN